MISHRKKQVICENIPFSTGIYSFKKAILSSYGEVNETPVPSFNSRGWTE
jgi:hypothetical protein